MDVVVLIFVAGDDVLAKVTCCATLADMASSQHSLDHLISCGVVSRMAELLSNAKNDPLADLYIPGANEQQVRNMTCC